MHVTYIHMSIPYARPCNRVAQAPEQDTWIRYGFT